MPIAPRCKMCLEFFGKKVYPEVWLQGGGGVDAVCIHGWPDKALEAYDNDLDRAYCREWTADTTAKDGKAAQTAAGPALVACQLWINVAVPRAEPRAASRYCAQSCTVPCCCCSFGIRHCCAAPLACTPANTSDRPIPRPPKTVIIMILASRGIRRPRYGRSSRYPAAVLAGLGLGRLIPPPPVNPSVG